MIYARVVEGQIVEVGTPTRDPVMLGDQWYDCRNATERQRYMNDAGWREVQETPKPADTETTTFDRGFQLQGDVPVEVWTERPLTEAEIENREATEEVNQILTDLRAGYEAIENASLAAFADITTASDKRDQALTLVGLIDTQKAQAQGWVSQTTTTAARADLYALRDQLVLVLDRQSTIVQAFAEMLAYRRANDENVVVTARALKWVARFIGGRI